jgi:hypothetical protein
MFPLRGTIIDRGKRGHDVKKLSVGHAQEKCAYAQAYESQPQIHAGVNRFLRQQITP